MDVNRSKYTSADGLTIILEVPQPPMGDESGYIQPPDIVFFRLGYGKITFTYSGAE